MWRRPALPEPRTGASTLHRQVYTYKSLINDKLELFLHFLLRGSVVICSHADRHWSSSPWNRLLSGLTGSAARRCFAAPWSRSCGRGGRGGFPDDQHRRDRSCGVRRPSRRRGRRKQAPRQLPGHPSLGDPVPGSRSPGFLKILLECRAALAGTASRRHLWAL